MGMREPDTISIPRSHGFQSDLAKEEPEETATWIIWAKEIAEWLDGRKERVYLDEEGDRRIGIGFRPDTPRGKKLLAELGIGYKAVISGGHRLNGREMKALLEKDVRGAVSKIVNWFKGFHDLSDARKAAFTYLAMCADLSELADFRDAMEDKSLDWEEKLEYLENTEWFAKSKHRGRNIRKILIEDKIEDITNA